MIRWYDSHVCDFCEERTANVVLVAEMQHAQQVGDDFPNYVVGEAWLCESDDCVMSAVLEFGERGVAEASIVQYHLFHHDLDRLKWNSMIAES